MKNLIVPLLLATITGFLFASEMTAQTTAAHKIVFAKQSFGTRITNNVLTLDDAPDHTLVQAFRIDVGSTNDPDFVIESEHVYYVSDRQANAVRYFGYSTYHMKGGDKVFIRWDVDSTPQGKRADGEPATRSGSIIVVGGTGRYKDIRGTGVWRIFPKGTLEEHVLDVTY